MFFLLDQKIDFSSKDDGNGKKKETPENKEEDKEENNVDEETEQIEDNVVDLYLQLYQDKTIPEILNDEGYDPQTPPEPEKQLKKGAKVKKGKKGKEPEKSNEKQAEETKKREEEIKKIEKDNLQQKRAILREVHEKERQLHRERVDSLWEELTGTLLRIYKNIHHLSNQPIQEDKPKEEDSETNNEEPAKLPQETKEMMYSLTNIRYIWKIFNRLVEDSLAVKFTSFHNSDKNKEFLIKAIKFAETCILEVIDKPIGELNAYEWRWLRCFFKYFQIVATQCEIDLKQLEFSKKILPTYMKIINLMSKFLGIYQDDKENKSTFTSKDNSPSKKTTTFYSVGGVDYTNEKIFETPHPYPRGDVSIKETYYFSKAIAVQIRFDSLCNSDSNCILNISTNDHSYWFNDNFGTSFRCSGRPHQRNPIILIPGNRVLIEFRATSHGGRRYRKTDFQGDEYIDRYGYRIAVNAIYAETALSSLESFSTVLGKRAKQSKSKSKDLSNWISLTNTLVHQASLMSQSLIKGSESKQPFNSVVTWNLLRGGISSGALDNSSNNPIAEYVQNLKEEKGIAYTVCKVIKDKLAPKFETKLPPILSAKFNDEKKQRWDYILNLAMICLMYHSDIIEDAFDYTQDEDETDPEHAKAEEKLKVVWKYTHNITKWMQSSLQGEKEIQILVRESLQIVENAIKEKYENHIKKWEEEKKKQKEEQEKIYNMIEEENKKKEAEKVTKTQEDDKKKGAPSSATIKVAGSKGMNKAKKRNRKKLITQVVVPKSKKKGKKGDDKEEQKEDKDKEEDSKEGDKPKEEVKEEEEKVPEISSKELLNLNNQIYNDVYSFILSKLKEENVLKSLCARFSIQNDENDPKPAVRQICKIIIKERMKQFIDFKKPKALKEIKKFDLTSLESPEMMIMNEIQEKLMFLLQVNPSIDLTSQILEGEKSSVIMDRLKSSKDLNLLKSTDNYSGFEGSSEGGDISMQRSKSAIVSPQNMHQLGRSNSRRIARASRFRNTPSNRNKEIQGLRGPQSSSFISVVSFVTNSTIRNLDKIKENIDTHYSTADNRLIGFDYYNKLLKLIKATNQSRSLVCPLATSVGDNPFVSIEASGIEKLKKTNNKIKETLKHCFILFVRDYYRLKMTVSEFIKAKQAMQKGQSKSNAARSSGSDELIIISQIRALLECLNDMIVILSDNPAREAFILHVVFEFTKSDTDFSEFLTNLVGLILDTKDSLIILNKSHISGDLISETQTAAKLLLQKFIIKDTEDSPIPHDAHSLLQETLLEIMVNMLKREMNNNDSENEDQKTQKENQQFLIQKFLATKYQRQVTLFILLRSVLMMSRSQENINEDLKTSCLDLVGECISTETQKDVVNQEERSYSTRVIRSACQVAKLCIDRDKLHKCFGSHKNESFIEMALKKIGQCLIVSDDRSELALQKFVTPTNDFQNIKIEEDKKEENENEVDIKQTKDIVIGEIPENDQEDYYYVYASINNNSDDCSFLVTAICELDKMWDLGKENAKPQASATPTKIVKTDASGKVKEETKEKTKEGEIICKTDLDKLIKFAMDIEVSMKNKGTTKISAKPKMTLKEAQTVAQTFYRAYEGDIPPVKITSEMSAKLKQSKLLGGVDIVQIYPSLCNKNEAAAYKAAPQPGRGPLIKLSRDQLQMTICKHTPGSSIKIDTASRKLINQRKY